MLINQSIQINQLALFYFWKLLTDFRLLEFIYQLFQIIKEQEKKLLKEENTYISGYTWSVFFLKK